MLLNCLLLMGNYYAYDNPAALSTLLQEHLSTLPKNEFDYTLGLFYSVYSVPNIVLYGMNIEHISNLNLQPIL